ncbi:HU family DNA-binding protein [Acinetobacter wuhouensis]|uniref:HU family DNA-binding protein n=1 Tax=Acinetobacter wuhouensis TaxID=1879050 RepID=A0A3G2T4P1_9GAMM|nr:HU family DNA-binding protein [Acinetobacter wuhouensis]AYO54942.1 HU family DNA-binding protein [Acinetobacter wuhouensis]
MNKSELVAAMAEKSELTKDQATKALNAFEAVVSETLKSGDEIALVGFGTFKVSDRAARPGRNPKTGEVIQIPASKVPTFKAGKALKEAVN